MFVKGAGTPPPPTHNPGVPDRRGSPSPSARFRELHSRHSLPTAECGTDFGQTCIQERISWTIGLFKDATALMLAAR